LVGNRFASRLSVAVGVVQLYQLYFFFPAAAGVVWTSERHAQVPSWETEMKNLAMAGLAVCFASGCATSTNYTPPDQVAVTNAIRVDRPFDNVWDQLVRELSSDFFVIKNIDKNSRIINISFMSNKPSDYVDCGRSFHKSSGIFTGEPTQYNTADSVTFYTNDLLGQAYTVRRTTRLEGRTNIYVAPEGQGTNVIVNTKYVLGMNIVTTAYDGRQTGQASTAIDFSTKSPALPTPTEVGCSTKGVIEGKILSFVSTRT
jgi:hypothetical protein